MSYKGRAQAIVIVEWILFIIPAILGISSCVTAYEAIHKHEQTHIIMSALAIPITVLIALLLNVFLTKGVNGSHSTSLKTWYIISIIVVGVFVINSVLGLSKEITLAQGGDALPLIFFVVVRGGILYYKVWAIYVIVHFSKEVIPNDCASEGTDSLRHRKCDNVKPIY